MMLIGTVLVMLALSVYFFHIVKETVHTHTLSHTHIYIYIYIERERERERERDPILIV